MKGIGIVVFVDGDGQVVVDSGARKRNVVQMDSLVLILATDAALLWTVSKTGFSPFPVSIHSVQHGWAELEKEARHQTDLLGLEKEGRRPPQPRFSSME